MHRKIKLEYLKLIRSKGATTVIARSFAIGMFIEFITLPTMGLAFFLLYPFMKVFRGSLPVALIGFVMGKFIVPFFLVLNYKVGALLVDPGSSGAPALHLSLQSLKENGLVFLTGSAIDGLVISLVCYGLVYGALVFYRKRKVIRRLQRQIS
ncbi:DUF2062 domain-containing protein [Ammoniphilus sp. YIM 78166]|uniref:DUF2062 domain-containing protein n=1 Tax=Ammoniphilus sp. YIM 78166 TaxID=1644106 RepID=UPI00106F5727|nr:DUF2062 domain-containing protein [Ammoniphilus sp. YIM 78166]